MVTQWKQLIAKIDTSFADVLTRSYIFLPISEFRALAGDSERQWSDHCRFLTGFRASDGCYIVRAKWQQHRDHILAELNSWRDDLDGESANFKWRG